MACVREEGPAFPCGPGLPHLPLPLSQDYPAKEVPYERSRPRVSSISSPGTFEGTSHYKDNYPPKSPPHQLPALPPRNSNPFPAGPFDSNTAYKQVCARTCAWPLLQTDSQLPVLCFHLCT
jgi:hypothetical protein